MSGKSSKTMEELRAARRIPVQTDPETIFNKGTPSRMRGCQHLLRPKPQFEKSTCPELQFSMSYHCTDFQVQGRFNNAIRCPWLQI